MLKQCKLHPVGRHHSGIDDTVNISRCVIHCLKKGFRFHQGHVNVLDSENTGFANADDFPFAKPEEFQHESYSEVDINSINAEFSWRANASKVSEKSIKKYEDSSNTNQNEIEDEKKVEEVLEEFKTIIEDQNQKPEERKSDTEEAKDAQWEIKKQSLEQQQEERKIEKSNQLTVKTEEFSSIPEVVDHPFYFPEIWKGFLREADYYKCKKKNIIAQGSEELLFKDFFDQDAGNSIQILIIRD